MSMTPFAGRTWRQSNLLEERWYSQGYEEAGNRQFVVIDPDGYFACAS
jgi:hypothetical protein